MDRALGYAASGVLVDCVLYENGREAPRSASLEDACHAGPGGGSFAWIRMHEPTAEELDALQREFDLPELAVEDALKAGQRPKLERYERILFMVVKPARYVDPHEVIEIAELLVFLGEGFVISVSHGRSDALDDARRRLDHSPDHLPASPGAVLHAIVDTVVDGYTPAADGVEEDIQEIEEQVFSPDRGNPAARIFDLEQEVLDFHRAVAGLTEPLDQLASQRVDPLDDELRAAFRDVHDHLLRTRARVDGFRELLASVLQANLTQVSVRQNEDMRKISAVVAIVAVPTMIAGIYGMNFEHMPELGWRFGYPLVLLVMATICTLLYRQFKRVGWL